MLDSFLLNFLYFYGFGLVDFRFSYNKNSFYLDVLFYDFKNNFFMSKQINHKKKRFAVYSFSEFLEENKNNPQGDPPQDDNNAENELNNGEEDLTINISEEIEILNDFKARKAEIILNTEEKSDLFIWFSETTLKSKTELIINKKLKEMFDGSIPPNLGMNAMDIPYDEYDINTNALTIKFEAVSKEGTFTYNLLGYSEHDLLPDIFKVSEKYRKVKKL